MSKVAGLFVFALLAAQSAPAQVLYGSIIGNVKDPTDAAVAGVSVVATHKETNQSRQAVTNELGSYSFPTLQAGPYDLRVTKEGFRTTTSEVMVTINSIGPGQRDRGVASNRSE